MTKMGVIGAMSVEIEHLHEILENQRITQKAHLTFYEGIIKGTAVVIVKSGIGKVNAAMCATILIEYFEVTHIINTGIAGGLHRDLRIFDVVVSTDAMHHDFEVTGFGYEVCTIPGMETSCFKADAFLINCTKKAWEKGNFTKKLMEGRIGTGDVFVNSTERKDLIRSQCNPACVEMEGAAIAQVCHLYNIPFVIIRCISDMAENAEEEYHEEKAAEISGFLVEHILEMIN